MEYVYRIDWGDSDCKLGHNNKVTRAWSLTNLFAFTSEKNVDGKFLVDYSILFNDLLISRSWSAKHYPK